MRVTIIVPTFNEQPNIAELVRRISASVTDHDAEILFVDDSIDDTPGAIAATALTSRVPVRLIHRGEPVGGLSGAVIEGLRASDREWCIVMDGDLQHPPEMIPTLLRSADDVMADVAVASRYVQGGSRSGLRGGVRRAVSSSSTSLTRAMFPSRLRNCTDPMTGFFAVRRQALDLDSLQPRGFKILLEILVRHRLAIVEEPFVFAERFAGSSKANITQGMRFLMQLAALRFGRMSRFAVIGVFGAVMNLAIMGALVASGMHYAMTAVIAAVTTILMNFFLQERFVFPDLRDEGRGFKRRFLTSMTFNGTEALIRLPVLALIVEFTPTPSLVAQAVTLGVAFVLRFVFHSRVVYRPRPTSATRSQLPGEISAYAPRIDKPRTL